MTKERVEIRARKPDGSLETIGHDFWFTRYGPVIVQPGRFDWSATRAYAIRDANLVNNRMLQTWHAMGGAHSLDGLEKAVNDLVGLPWVNTIAADREGRALYLDVTPTPAVSAAKLERCVAKEHRELVAENLFVLDGSDPGCDWDVDPAAPQEGIVPGDRLHSLRRSDFVQNSNDSAWMTNPARPLTGFSPLVSKADQEQQGRTRMGIAQVAARIAGTDGLPGKRFTLEQLQQVSFSNRVFYASLVRAELNALCADPAAVTIDGASVPLGEACAVLRAWDGTAGSNSVGYPLFGLWWDRMEDNKAIWAAPDRQVEQTAIWAVPFSPADPVNTPRGLRVDDPAVRRFALESLGAAIVELEKRGIDWRKPWGEIQYEEAKGERVPVPGGASGDVYNIMYSVPEPPGRMVVALGSSYVLTVSWDDDGRPVADAVLTYSQSFDPDSPHSGDQIPVFSAGQWIRQPFAEAQIRADPAYTSVTISE
jgi:acyl-homoserine-lactone acylase